MNRRQTLRSRAATLEEAALDLIERAENWQAAMNTATPYGRRCIRAQLLLAARTYGDAVRSLARVRL